MIPNNEEGLKYKRIIFHHLILFLDLSRVHILYGFYITQCHDLSGKEAFREIVYTNRQ